MISSILYFSMTVMTTILSLSSISMKGMYISRTLNELTPDHISDAIVFIDYSGVYYGAYYDYKIFKENINNYFKASLKGKVDKYKAAYVCYERDKKTNEYFYVSGYSDDQIHKIDVYFECTYDLIFTFKGKVGFTITGEEI